MSPKHYQKIYRWFCARPTALEALKCLTRSLPLAMGAGYGVLLANLAFVWWDAARLAELYPAGTAELCAADFCRTLLVPAITLLGGTLLRRVIDAPRPYDNPDFVPLLEKETTGRACPSRHALSAGVIAAVWWAHLPTAGVLMLALAVGVCITRVLAGVHSVRDVLFGAALGLACGAAGMLL